MTKPINATNSNKTDTNTPTANDERSFDALPKVHTTYANVIKSLLPNRDKQIDATGLPSVTYRVKNLAIDSDNLNEYRKICGFVNDGRVPATYFAVLSQTLQMNMMAQDDFPFAMLGLIHLANQVTQYRPIDDSELVELSVTATNLQAHDKGQQFDFITKVYSRGELIWQGSSTYLSRQKTKKTQPKSKNTPPPKLAKTADGFSYTVNIPEDIGRRYAFVSGDFNLIHLHALSARAFGYPKAIAHGMWSNAKALSLFKNLPECFSCTISFKSPIFLPSSIELIASLDNDGNDWQFGAYSGDKVHFVGRIDTL